MRPLQQSKDSVINGDISWHIFCDHGVVQTKVFTILSFLPEHEKKYPLYFKYTEVTGTTFSIATMHSKYIGIYLILRDSSELLWVQSVA